MPIAKGQKTLFTRGEYGKVRYAEVFQANVVLPRAAGPIPQRSCSLSLPDRTFLGLARVIYIRCIYSIFGREITGEITKYTVMFGVCNKLAF
jgi:hypothetical protein